LTRMAEQTPRRTVMNTLGLPDLPKFGAEQERWLAEQEEKRKEAEMLALSPPRRRTFMESIGLPNLPNFNDTSFASKTPEEQKETLRIVGESWYMEAAHLEHEANSLREQVAEVEEARLAAQRRREASQAEAEGVKAAIRRNEEALRNR